MTAVYKHCKLHRGRTPFCYQRIYRGSCRSACIKHVVHKHDIFVGDVKFNVGRVDYGVACHFGKIVAVEGDVKLSAVYLFALDLFNVCGYHFGYRHTAAADADQTERVASAVSFDYFVRDPFYRAHDRIFIHYKRFVLQHKDHLKKRDPAVCGKIS